MYSPVLKRCIDCIASQPEAETPQKNSKAKAKAKASPLSKAKPSPVQSKLSPAKRKTKPSPKTKGKGKEKAKDSKEKTVTTKGAQKKRKDAAEAGHGHFVLCAQSPEQQRDRHVYRCIYFVPSWMRETSSLDICRTLFKAEFCNKRGRKDFQQLSQANCCLDSCLGVLGVPKVVPAKFL
jgi:hypothetical protein